MKDRLISIAIMDVPGSWLIPDSSIIWLSALIVGLTISIRSAKKRGLDPKIMAKAGLWSILGGHWGGHLLEVLATPKALIEDPFLFVKFVSGGKAVFGALLGGAIWGLLYLRWKKASFLAYADAAAPAFALGYSVARIGCFLNGCCFGTHSDLPWAVRFPEHTMAFFDHWSKGWLQSDDVLSLPVHPTQLYHAAAGFFLFLLLRQCQGKWRGSRVALGIASYGFLRFFLQFVRGDRTPVLGFLDINQIFSLIFLLFAGLLWWRFGRTPTASRRAIPASPSADAMQPERL